MTGLLRSKHTYPPALMLTDLWNSSKQAWAARTGYVRSDIRIKILPSTSDMRCHEEPPEPKEKCTPGRTLSWSLLSTSLTPVRSMTVL
jgi:hypothetical protein